MNQVIEHPSGVFLHVQYIPRTAASKPVVQDVRLADVNYEPIGPNLMQFLNSTYLVENAMATPMLESIIHEVESHEPI